MNKQCGLLTLTLAVAPMLSAQSPDSLRESFRLQLAASVSARSNAEANEALRMAGQLARAYSAFGADSSLVYQLDRFERWGASARRTKVESDSLRRAGFERFPREGAAAVMPVWQRSWKLAASIADSAGMAATMGNLGAGYLTLGDLDSAQIYLQRSRRIAARLNDWRVLGNALGLLGSTARARGDLDAAQSAFAAASVARARAQDDRGAAADQNNVGLIARELGDTVAARRAFEASLASNLSAGRDGAAATNLVNLAALASDAGELPRAESLFRKAVVGYARASEKPGQGRALRNLGNALISLGRYDDASRTLSEAVRLLEETGQWDDVAAACADLAQARAAMGDLGAAHEAVMLGERLTDAAGPGARALLALTAGDLAVDADDYRAAVTSYTRAESLAVAAGDTYTATEAREGLGAMQLRRGDTRGAIRTLSAAVEALRADGDVRASALSALHLGAAQATANDTVAARRTLEAARDVFRTLRDPVGEAAAIGELARLAEQRGERPRAESLFRQGLGRLASNDAPDVASSLRWGLGHVLRLGGNLAGAERELRAAAAAGAALSRDVSEIRGELALVQHVAGDDAGAFLTSDGLRAGADETPRLTLNDLAANLETDEALIEYLITDSATLAFVAVRGTVRAIQLDMNRQALAAAVDFVRATLVPTRATDRRAPWLPPLRRLDRVLIEPLEAAGLLDGVRSLLIAPHAELHRLPFAALVSHRTGRHLVQRYDVSYVPSAARWVALSRRQRRSTPGTFLAFAPFPTELPGSGEEARAIGKQRGPRAKVLVGARATRSAFSAEAANYDVIHLATYGVLNSRNPAYSYVALAPEPGDDGRLAVKDVSSGVLQARLVVLSACETALASGSRADVPAEGEWIGLARAFLDAGADNVLASLWPVGDQATAAFMKQYHRLLGDRRPGEALSATQRLALARPETASPEHWAAFAVVGAER